MISNGGSSSSFGWFMGGDIPGLCSFEVWYRSNAIPFQFAVNVHCLCRKRRCQAPFHPLFTSNQANGRRGQNPESIERIAGKTVARRQSRRARSKSVVTCRNEVL